MPHHHPVASREEWLKAQQTHLKTEKALTRMRDLVAAERRALPWLRVEKPYVFDSPEGERMLGDLFNGNSQLIVHHLMYHPDWEAACVGCSFQADHIDGPRPHLEQHDVSIVAVSRAPMEKIEAYRKRMGWNFPWVSSGRSDFNQDFHVSFRPDEVESGRIDYNFGTITVDPRYHSEELPGVSVFYRDLAGDIFLAQSIYARGLDLLIGASHYLDITPKGRNEAGNPDWIRRRDEYEGAGTDRCCGEAST
jgi:predicted dithiol-disulfide oxidoreductase (DUF899 family)